LKEIGITIYPGAEFNEVNYKYHNNSISYDIVPATPEGKEKVDQYYQVTFEKIQNNGWKKLLSLAEQPRYGNGDEVISFSHAFSEQAGMNRIIFIYSKSGK